MSEAVISPMSVIEPASRLSVVVPLPSRRSSEAPEVVPGQLDLHPFVYINYAERHKRAPSEDSQCDDASEDRSRESKGLVPTPQIEYDGISFDEKPVRQQRVFGLMTMVVLVLVAFFIGGGIGGGVGGALVAKEKSRFVFLWSEMAGH